jgi:hypothetical protein
MKSEIRYVDSDAISAHSAINKYLPVDPNTNDEMGKKLLMLQKTDDNFSCLLVGYEPDKKHHMNEEHDDGIQVKWDYEYVKWDHSNDPKKVFKKYFAQQVFPDNNAKPSLTCDLPAYYVVHYQFMWRGRYYCMFLKSCLGKFGAFHQYAVPCDGSDLLRINLEKETIVKLTLSGDYQRVSSLTVMSFKVHRMVLFLWGGPNNSPWEMSNALEGDHKHGNKSDYCVLDLQWLNQLQNLMKG